MAFADEDDERIGGQYIAMRVVLNGDAVIGYELRIADAEKNIKLNRKWQVEQKAKASRSGTVAPRQPQVLTLTRSRKAPAPAGADQGHSVESLGSPVRLFT